MIDIYWITRFDSIHYLGIVMFWISLMLFAILWITSITTDDYTGEDLCTEKQKYRLRKGANYSIVTFIIGLILWVFIPTKEEAFLIYGVGSTIDYIKQNPTAQKLPDKCVNALDKWVDSWNKEKDSDK